MLFCQKFVYVFWHNGALKYHLNICMLTFLEYLTEDAPGIINNPDPVGLNRLKDYYPTELAGLISRDGGHTVYLWVKSRFTMPEVVKAKAIKDIKQYYWFYIKMEHKKALSLRVQPELSPKDPIYNKIHTIYTKLK